MSFDIFQQTVALINLKFFIDRWPVDETKRKRKSSLLVSRWLSFIWTIALWYAFLFSLKIKISIRLFSGMENWPGVYTRVRNFKKLIEKFECNLFLFRLANTFNGLKKKFSSKKRMIKKLKNLFFSLNFHKNLNKILFS